MIAAFHSASVSVREATCFGIEFILRPKSPVASSIPGHAAAKPSYVTRPSTSASLEYRYSACMSESWSFQNGPVHPGSSTTPSSETYMASLSLRIVSPSLVCRIYDRTRDRFSSRAGV